MIQDQINIRTKISGFVRLCQHPIFPLLLLLPITQIVREQFPISHYPMFSRPLQADVSFLFVSGSDGIPIPIKIETGITVAQMRKKYSFHKKEIIRDEEQKGHFYGEMTKEKQSEIEASAAIETLNFLRVQSLKRRPGKDLTGELRLVQVDLHFTGEDYVEQNKTLAILAPAL